MENKHERKLKKLVLYRAGEFLNNQFKELSEECGFIHFFYPPETPQHNGYAEQANRTILEKARCLINPTNHPKRFWAEAVNTAVYLSNLSPTISHNNKSPHLLCHNLPAKINRLKTFGCRAIMFNHHKHRDWKLAPPGSEAQGEDNWCWLPNKNPNDSKELQSYEETNPWEDEIPMDEDPIIPEMVDEPHSEIVETQSQINHQPRIKVIGPRDPTLISSNIDQLNLLPFPRTGNALITNTLTIPSTYKSALKSEDRVLWQEAINKELNKTNQHNIWEVIDMKEDYKLVGTAWIFRIKTNDQNEATEYKARLCAQGFIQTQGYDFNKTFAPTGRLNSLRTLIVFASKNNLEFHQINVKSSFLNAELTGTIYLAIPQGLNEDQ
ncbi:hypothetical protein O181_001715 [Austropuccinia psidii MF-1]|uniref:Integrase catalytic domain-containing protein n=1 Tax=Austropuccinia psidii MF-1 TaxID=1389203 RepID=A0A9Q3BBK1_9BASI|nr:hypothetical protein [Austropuccinia psidii MF-1]